MRKRNSRIMDACGNDDTIMGRFKTVGTKAKGDVIKVSSSLETKGLMNRKKSRSVEDELFKRKHN